MVGSLCINSGSSSSSSSASSSSDEDDKPKRDKKKDAGGPARFCFVGDKRDSSKHGKKRRSRKDVCSMALEENNDNHASDSDSDPEVIAEQDLPLLLSEANKLINL